MSNQQKKRMGCFGWGCIILLVLALLGGIGIYLGTQHLIHLCTSDAPSQIKVDPPTATQIESTKRKLDAFFGAITNGMPVQVKLTADDLNTAVSENVQFAAVKGHCSFEIKDSRVVMETSIPLDKVPLLKGRYLNGKFTLKLVIAEGELVAKATSIELKGASLPQDFMKSFSEQNLAENLNRDPQFSGLLQVIQSLRVENDLLIIETQGWKGDMGFGERVPTPRNQPAPPPIKAPPPSQPFPVPTDDTKGLKSDNIPPPAPLPPKKEGDGSIVIEGYDPPPK